MWNTKRFIVGVGVYLLISTLVGGGLLAFFTYRDIERHRRFEKLEEIAKVQREEMLGKIGRQARIDALDLMQQRQSQNRVFSELKVKEIDVSYLGDMFPTYERPPEKYGYRADMIVSIRSNIGVVSNVTTHRLKLQYHTDGKFWPEKSEVMDIGTLDLNSPLLSR